MATLTGDILETTKHIPVDAEVELGYYQLDSELIRLVDVVPPAVPFTDPSPMLMVAEGTPTERRPVGGSTAATHTSGATLTRYYPDAATGAASGIPDPTGGDDGDVPTVDGGAYVLAPPTGGVQTVYSATVTLSLAQIRALPTTPVEVVPPTEVLDYSGTPTELFVPLHCHVVVRNDDAFTNVDDTPVPTVKLVVGSDFSMSVMTVEYVGVEDATLILVEGTQFAQMVRTGMDFADPVALANNFKDNGLYLAGSNGDLGDFTGGGAGTTWDATVVYVVMAI